MWLDDAVELLFLLPYTCSLDVAEDFTDGLIPKGVAAMFGISEQRADKETRDAASKLRTLLVEGGLT